MSTVTGMLGRTITWNAVPVFGRKIRLVMDESKY
jgi:hypothetical protein